ncbi:MAG: ISAs1 family transposase [Saprospiraceae bacterium]|nr:ISAs1 family transposase [Saprospiraceae bacterium]
MKIAEIFQTLPDPRRTTLLKMHNLSDILMLSLLATVSGCENDEEIAEYGKSKEAFLRGFLSLPNGIPSHDTITRVLNALDKQKFAECLYAHSRYLLDFFEQHHISIDGKVLRGTSKRGKKNSGICIVSAWACEQSLVLGQLQSEEKSNEKTAIPELIDQLELQDALVSIDAAGNSPAIAQKIVDKGGHYLLALKKNQGNTYEEVHDFMKARMHTAHLSSSKTVDFGSGRIETRTCYVSHNTDLMEETLKWKDVQSVVLVHAQREIEGKTQEEYRFYLSDKKQTPEYFNHKVRQHWSIENKLHWHLDVSFKEDKSRTRTDNGAENRNILRKIALQLLQQDALKKSIAVKRKKAAWDDQYLLNVISQYIV